MKKHFAVIGLGMFGHSLATALAANKCEVTAIDRNSRKVNSIAEQVTLAVEADATDIEALAGIGVKEADAAAVCIGENIEASILSVMVLKELGIMRIVAKAETELHEKVLMRLGVSRIVHPERDMALRLANSLVKPELLEYLELSPDYSVVEISAPGFLVGKKISETELRAKYGISIIALKAPPRAEGGTAGEWNINPSPDDTIITGDLLVVLGANSDIERLRADSST